MEIKNMNNSDSLTLVNVNADNIVKSFSILLPSKRKEIELKQKEKEERLEAERRAEAARLEAERQAEAARLEYEAKKKKVYTTIILSTAILILFVFLGIKLYHIIDIKIQTQKALEASRHNISLGDSCLVIYHFDEANKYYSDAIIENNNIMEKEEVREMNKYISKKQEESAEYKQKIDEEYNKYLKRLKVLLIADDNVFNKYSNECLDNMIRIYPNRKETIYYKNLRGK